MITEAEAIAICEGIKGQEVLPVSKDIVYPIDRVALDDDGSYLAKSGLRISYDALEGIDCTPKDMIILRLNDSCLKERELCEVKI
ncbi:MAG TPA: hypothetical protein VMC80_02960 [Patescibacteria group bacterium]|nr:hypothetical protein [Patescibacteria group bacterium]